eukprot:767658-Hanusia_phi.AAC.6
MLSPSSSDFSRNKLFLLEPFLESSDLIVDKDGRHFLQHPSHVGDELVDLLLPDRLCHSLRHRSLQGDEEAEEAREARVYRSRRGIQEEEGQGVKGERQRIKTEQRDEEGERAAVVQIDLRMVLVEDAGWRHEDVLLVSRSRHGHSEEGVDEDLGKHVNRGGGSKRLTGSGSSG